jgi:pimeloyl-ACP methyl ester carboxylesterase
MATVTVNGVELYYETAGEGERVVLTHGAWSDGKAWEAVVDRLSDRFETVIWDRRGHSRSQDGPGPGSVRQDAADLGGLISHLGDERVHLVGNSAGGSVTLNLLTMRSDLVRSAAAHEPGPYSLLEGSKDHHIVGLVDEDKRNVAHVTELIENGRHRQAAEYFVDDVAVGPGAWGQFPEELRTILVSNAPTVPDDLRDAYDPESLDVGALATSDVPMLITTGTHSPPTERAAVEELTRRVPAAHLAILEGAGHIPHRTHPAEYVSVLLGFIDGLAGHPSAAATAKASPR